MSKVIPKRSFIRSVMGDKTEKRNDAYAQGHEQGERTSVFTDSILGH